MNKIVITALASWLGGYHQPSVWTAQVPFWSVLTGETTVCCSPLPRSMPGALSASGVENSCVEQHRPRRGCSVAPVQTHVGGLPHYLPYSHLKKFPHYYRRYKNKINSFKEAIHVIKTGARNGEKNTSSPCI